jgi:ketosteroid isomerase-like protein
MKHSPLFLLIASILFFGCQSSDNQRNIEKWKSEIVAVEKAFNDMAADEGIANAFAADNGVIMRNMKIISGKKAIADFTRESIGPDQSLAWSPTFVDVSASGDLAYTYGTFTFTYADSLGNKNISKGIFHTVWKRQDDGNWRYVWD